MKAFFVSAKLFLFLIVFTAVGLTLYLLFPAFHTGSSFFAGDVGASAAARPVIVLDPGHGGQDGGAIAPDGTAEKDLNLAMAKDIYGILKYSGFRVILTRESDGMLGDGGVGKKKQADLAKRLEIAEESPDSILVSIHMNKFPDARCRGLQVYYSANHPAGQALAQTVQSTVSETLQTDNNRKIKAADSAIYILNKADVPAILIECGFLSNGEELARLKDENYRKELAAVIAAALINGVTNEGT